MYSKNFRIDSSVVVCDSSVTRLKSALLRLCFICSRLSLVFSRLQLSVTLLYLSVTRLWLVCSFSNDPSKKASANKTIFKVGDKIESRTVSVNVNQVSL